MKWSLRAKLFVFVPVLALLPWLGWQTLERLQLFAIRAQTEALAVLAQTLAQELSSEASVRWRPSQSLPGRPPATALQSPVLDGFLDDWVEAQPIALSQLVTLRAMQRGAALYLAIDVRDLTRQYRRPTQDSASDRLLITLLKPTGDEVITIAPEGPGRWFSEGATRARASDAVVTGYWWELAEGYRFEARLSASRLLDASGWVLSVVDASSETQVTRSYPIPIAPMHPWIQQRAEAFATETRQVVVSANDGRILAMTGAIQGAADLVAEESILSGTAVSGRVTVQSRADQVVGSASRALIQLAWQIMAVLLIVLLGLSVYAGRLTERIARLGRELRAQLDARGRLAEPQPLTALKATDEIGDLARDIAQVMADLRRYTQFLERIPRTLRHELSNPMSTVQTSLELLAEEQDPTQQARLRAAAARGIAKLDSTLSRVTEAVSLEEALREDVLSPVDLTKLLEMYVEVQREQHPRIQWRLDVPTAPIRVMAHSLRLEQLLDKLIDNALDYTPDQGRIWLKLRDQVTSVSLAVENEGPTDVAFTGADVFQLFSSARQDASGAHLGLGLYVVRTIAEAFEASARIESTGRGVQVTIQGFRHVPRSA
ncbi:MAG: hypothetical protein EBS77_01370 [Gammaproteobacteria bacterium]|nr:hypothetical protein [Gammaproteobacteria bacterium]